MVLFYIAGNFFFNTHNNCVVIKIISYINLCYDNTEKNLRLRLSLIYTFFAVLEENNLTGKPVLPVTHYICLSKNSIPIA